MVVMDKDGIENKKVINKKRRKKSVFQYKILSFLLVVITIISLSVIIYNEVFALNILIPTILISLVTLLLFTKILNSKLRRSIKNFFSFISIVVIIFMIILLLFGTKTLKFIANITDTGYRVDTYGVYVLKDSSYNNIKELENKEIGVLSETDKYTKKAISLLDKKITTTIVNKDNLSDLLTSIINKKIDAIMLEESYESTIDDEYDNVLDRLKKIDTFDVIHVIDTIKSTKDISKDPFMVYISGIDTSGSVAAKARSDVNILVGVNPKTKKILMINTPRDYYVTLDSKNKKDKLTHAGLYGIEESLNTLSNLYDKKIDYYARFNFSSFMDVVNALGGVKVNVKYNICEQDSKRNKNNQICVYKGLRTLNGEQALAYSRHRKTIGDRQRGKNQMDVLEGIINTCLSPKILTKYISILDAMDSKVITNMEFDDIKKFINLEKNNKKSWEFSSISATGKDSSNQTYSTGRYKVYVMEPDESSIIDIKNSINNLYNGEEIIVNTTNQTITKKK